MAIKSHAFGRVTLTKDDAAKFSRQVKYGRSSGTAKKSVERGLKLNEEFKSGGRIVIKTIRQRKDKVSA